MLWTTWVSADLLLDLLEIDPKNTSPIQTVVNMLGADRCVC